MTTLSKDFQDAIIAEKVVRAKLANGPDAQGGFTVVIATKKNSAGDLVVDKDGDIYRDSVGVQLGVPIGCDQHADCGLEPAGFADTGEDEFVIFATGVLDLSSEHGLAQYAQWKERRETQEFSYRYFVNEQAPAMVNGRRVNELIRVTVVSIDPVSRGAGIDTGIREMVMRFPSLLMKLYMAANLIIESGYPPILRTKKPLRLGYHEAVHLSRPKMGESQVRVETGYFAEWLHNPYNRPNFDRMAASLEGSR